MKHILLLFVFMLILPGAQSAERYRWTDKAGNVHYGDTPPADAINIRAKNISGAQSSNDNLSFAARLAQKNFPVTLHMGNGCGEPCDKGRSLLKKRGIPFAEKMLATQADIDEFTKQTGSNSVPVLAVGTNYLKGYSAESWHNALSAAGYPKDAPYRAPPTPPSVPPAPASENAVK
ncbi:MAG: glutaredoxin family protein [Candidatus Nitrotoga sp.]